MRCEVNSNRFELSLWGKISLRLYHEEIITLEHVYMRREVNSNWFEISLQGKISLQCEVTSLSTFT